MYNRARRKEIEYESTLQYKILEGKAIGILEGKAEGKAEVALTLLQNTNHSHSEIAKLVGIPLEMVRKLSATIPGTSLSGNIPQSVADT